MLLKDETEEAKGVEEILYLAPTSHEDHQLPCRQQLPLQPIVCPYEHTLEMDRTSESCGDAVKSLK